MRIDLSNTNSAAVSRSRNSKNGGGAVESIRNQIKLKQEEMKRIKSDSTLSSEAKDLKTENIQKQIEGLEEQLSKAVIEQQQRQLEQKSNEIQKKSNIEKSDEQQTTELLVSADLKLKSAQREKVTEAEIERDVKREFAFLKNGGNLPSRIKEIEKLKLAEGNLKASINQKYADVNTYIKEDVKEKEEDKTDPVEIEKNKKLEEKENKQKPLALREEEIIGKYERNAFDNYKDNDK